MDTTVPDVEHDEPPKGRWYVLRTYSGYEHKVKRSIEHRVEALALGYRVHEVVVPGPEWFEIRRDQDHSAPHRLAPGYVLVRMEMDDDTWYALRNTPGVTGFVNVNDKPTPLDEPEVST